MEFCHDALRDRRPDAIERLERAFYEGRLREAEAVDEHLNLSAVAHYPIQQLFQTHHGVAPSDN